MTVYVTHKFGNTPITGEISTLISTYAGGCLTPFKPVSKIFYESTSLPDAIHGLLLAAAKSGHANLPKLVCDGYAALQSVSATAASVPLGSERGIAVASVAVAESNIARLQFERFNLEQERNRLKAAQSKTQVEYSRREVVLSAKLDRLREIGGELHVERASLLALTKASRGQ